MAEHKTKLQDLAADVREADQDYSEGRLVESAERLTQVQEELVTLLQGTRAQSMDADLRLMAESIYTRLQKSHRKLALDGAELPPLESWSILTAPVKATGDTVSFARDVAPLLLQNCNGCHLAGQRASGNLRMDSYELLMRGGDSGQVIAGRNATESLLIQRLRGELGERMPAGGRPGLSEDQIGLIANWIREGAEFDGRDRAVELQVLIDQSWAADASHQELFARRQQRSMESWRRFMPDQFPLTTSGDEVFVLGNLPQSELDATLTRIERAVEQTKKLLGVADQLPLFSGGLCVFVLQSRYDYGEFGRMAENRDLPKEWFGHWKADALDVYAVLAVDREQSDKQASGVALEVVAGAYFGSLKAPYWFAEGAARNLVAATFRRGDPRVVSWQASLPKALQNVDSAKSLLENKLDEETAGVVGMALTSVMINRANRPRFDKLLELLREGRDFNDAFTFAFAPPEDLISTWLQRSHRIRGQ